jgi:hypothetical protein
MKRTCTIIQVMAVVACLVALAPSGVSAQATAVPSLKGVWVGKADILLPDGKTHQVHKFEFLEQDGAYLKGRHSWDIPAKNLKSHVGETATFHETEPLLGIVAYDGTVEIVEQGDTTRFRMRLMDADTLEFVAWEGGAHPLVGRGVLVRE